MFAPYYEKFIVKKQNIPEKIIGKLLLSEDKCIRINWIEGERFVHSIDLWNNFEFYGKGDIMNDPDYTLNFNQQISITKYLPDIIKFYRQPEMMVELKNQSTAEESSKEEVEVGSLMDEESMDVEIDLFEAMRYNTFQVASGVSNSLLITGIPGVGKSFEVLSALDEMNADYITIKGGITTAGLFETLFLNRDKLILFDDCDDVFSDEGSINILKAVLDTYPKREVSRMIKTHFDVIGMTEKDVYANHKGDINLADNKNLFNPKNKGKMPKQFIFTGQIIFISNLKGDEIDPAIISRTLHIDVDLTREQILSRMRNVMGKTHRNISMDVKEEALNFLDFITSNFETKFPLNIRSLIHSINIRISNDLTTVVGGKKYPLWQLLIKKYLTK